MTEQFRIDMEKQLKALREDRVEELKFPPDLSNDQRRFVHRLCEKLGLHSKSRGKGEKRYLTVAKKKITKPQPRHPNDEPEPVEALALGKPAAVELKQYFDRYPPGEADARGRPVPNAAKASGQGVLSSKDEL